MTIELLIEAIVRQTTILIAQLATSGGTRAPLAQVANQVFLDLVHELERQGVSRKVSADMFGLGLRTYQRKIQRYTESSTDRGRSLWVAVLDFVQSSETVTRAQVLEKFAGDDESQVRGVLHDLCESGLVSVSGTGARMKYRLTPEEELEQLRQSNSSEGVDELLWAMIYREGPCSFANLAKKPISERELTESLARLVEAGRVECDTTQGYYSARALVLPLGSPVGWEAAVFDHFKALVNTITCRLSIHRSSPNLADRVGGSTYTLDVWPGHPHEQEALGTLRDLRQKLGELRDKVEGFNAHNPVPESYTQVLLYAGQCLIQQGASPSRAPASGAATSSNVSSSNAPVPPTHEDEEPQVSSEDEPTPR
ncbi:MAG TPA: hypothetical protein VFQ61_05050 [Polyangiaceae bacterium]|nr:hypothetical protein [Polyangiaceae bacterium]